MKTSEEKYEKKITIKSYIIIVLIAILTIILTLYVCKWIKVSKEEQLNTSPLTNNVSELYLTELEETMNENGEVILYFGYTNDEKVYDLEEKMLKSINKDDLSDFVYYINVTNYKENGEYKTYIEKSFPDLAEEDLTSPLFIYAKNSDALKVVTSTKKLVTIKEFVNLTELLETE